MLKSLSIKNFQSHANTKIQFHPGINAVVGVSDSGKSAVLRALHWNRENRPTGEAHISHWAKNDKGKLVDSCEVVVETANGSVKRVRGPKLNTYEIDGSELEAISTTVPAQVADAWNFTEVNVQRQLDAPFLLSRSGPDIARFFNQVVNLEEMGQLMSAAEGKSRDLIKDRKSATKRLSELDKRVDSLSWLDGAQVDISKAQKCELDIFKLGVATKELEGLKSSAISARERAVASNKIIACEGITERALMVQASLAGVRNESLALSGLSEKAKSHAEVIRRTGLVLGMPSLTSQATEIEITIAKNRSTAKALDGAIAGLKQSLSVQKSAFNFDLASILVENAFKMAKNIAEAKAKSASLFLAKREIGMKNAIVETKIAEITTLEANLPEMCPTCGQVTAKHSHKSL